MCIIITSDTEFPFNRVLELAEIKNSHGGGIAWLQGDKVHWVKDITAKDMKLWRHNTEGPWVIHFRIATAGGVCSELCHPFPVGVNTSLDLVGTSDAVIAHNGHWWDWKKEFYGSLGEKDTLPEGPWSDSRAIAWMLGKYGENYTKFIRNQRIAYLDKNGVRRYGEGWLRYGPLWLSNNLFSGQIMHSVSKDKYSVRIV